MNLNYYVGGQLFYNLHHCRNDHALPARVQVSFNFINKQDNCLLSWSNGQPMHFEYVQTTSIRAYTLVLQRVSRPPMRS